MDTYKFLRAVHEGGLATITLNRPEVYNALNDEATFELQRALTAAGKDEAIRVVVLTGEGKAFCAGQDLKDASSADKRSLMESLHKRYNPIIRAIRNMPKPVLCRLNGVAAGAGGGIALACDMVIAAEEARLVEAFVNVGLVPDSGVSFFLPRTVGMAKAFEMCAMGAPLTAAEAVKLGLINRVVPAGQLDSVMKEFTDYFLNAPTRAIGLMKKMLHRSANATLEETLEYEAWCQEIAGRTEDHREGVAAFRDKRKPVFKGV